MQRTFSPDLTTSSCDDAGWERLFPDPADSSGEENNDSSQARYGGHQAPYSNDL